ncbi:MAG: hypothetical protein LBO67_10300 [Spirochaetaceae bacterium]|jgi:hypothetical protein|nr:hypothetical protein [Spirochaetaceae bacterium]
MNRAKQMIVCTIASACMALTALKTVEALPSFVTDPPVDEQYYYEFGEAEDTDKARAWAAAEKRAQEKPPRSA